MPEGKPGLDEPGTSGMSAQNGFFDVPWSPMATVWVILLQFAVVTLIGVVLAQLVVADALSESGQRVLLLPASSGAAAALTLVVIARRHPGHTWRLRGPLRPSLRHIPVGLGYGVVSYLAVGFGLASVLQYLITSGGGELPQIQQTFREFAGDPGVAPVFVATVVLLTPVGEELLFRGLLFQSLRTRLGMWPAVGFSAVAFGLIHVDPTLSMGGNLLVFTMIFAFGMVLAWMFHRTGSLVVPIVAHGVFNGTSAVLLMLQ